MELRVSYELDPYDGDVMTSRDEEIEHVVGKEADATGFACCKQRRDLLFTFDTFEAAVAARKRITMPYASAAIREESTAMGDEEGNDVVQ